MTSAVKNFNNEVDRMTQSWIPVNIFLQPPWSSPNGLKGDHGGRNKVYLWDKQHGLLLSKTDLTIITAEAPICKKQRPTLSPQYDTSL